MENFEGNTSPTSPEGAEVQPETETLKVGGEYNKTVDFFESYAENFPGQLEQAKSAGDEKVVAGIIEAQNECSDILRSLENGDVEPAVNKISSMIEQNLTILREGLSDPDSSAERVEIIKEMVDYLAELRGVEAEPIEADSIKETTDYFAESQNIEAGKGRSVAHHLEKFQGLDHPEIALKLIEAWPKEEKNVKELVNDHSHLEALQFSDLEGRIMAEYEELGVIEFLDEFTAEEFDKFVAERSGGSKDLEMSPVYDNKGDHTGRYKVYEIKRELTSQKQEEVNRISERAKEGYENINKAVEEHRLEMMEQQVEQGNAEDLGELTLAELYSQHPDFKPSKDVLIRLYDHFGSGVDCKYRAFRWKAFTLKE